MSTPFPFSAVAGHDGAKLALVLAAMDPGLGGVLLRGQKGSAKTTLARGLAALLPGPAPFAELPVGATEDRLVGSLDLAAALTGGEVKLRPGLLAAAHGGVLYVDEVNLLADHLVDVLLDVAASGVNRVEREGISAEHPARFVLIGSMNPEEGELRPQLLDRFGLAVDVVASADPAERALAVHRRLAFDAGPEDFARAWAGEETDLAGRLGAAACSGRARLGDDLVAAVCSLCVSVGAEGLRADLVICRAARALAGWEGREQAGPEDVRRVAGLALAHRRRRSPFEEPGMDAGQLDRALDEALGGMVPPSESPPPGRSEGPAADGGAGSPPPGRSGGARGDLGAGSPPPGRSGSPRPGAAPNSASASRTAPTATASAGTGAGAAGPERVAGIGDAAPLIGLGGGRQVRRSGEGGAAPAAGRRGPEAGARGRLVGDRPAQGSVSSVAVGATVRAAAGRRAAGGAASPVAGGPMPMAGAEGPLALACGGGPLVAAGDVREAVREQRAANLVVLAVDASGSMGAARRMEAAKGAVLSLLLDAYQRRDRVALVTFRGDGAEVALRPTGSVEVARARLAQLPTGGRTPLAAGIAAALEVAEAARAGAYRPLLVVLTDGRATAGPPGADPLDAALASAGAVRRRGVGSVVVDAEEEGIALGLARTVAGAMGARYLTLGQLSAGALAGALREAVAPAV